MTDLRYFSLGRHALKVGLELAGVMRGDSVMLPGFICRDLISSLYTVGARPVYYGVDADLKPEFLDPTIRPRVIVAVNYFGFAQDLEPFRKYCDQTGAILVEDNAHGFLSRDLQNNPLGQRTTVGITSFRKTLQVSDGAILSILSHNTELPNQLPYAKPNINLRQKLLSMATNFERTTKIPTMSLAQSTSQFARQLATGSSLPISGKTDEQFIPGVANPTTTSIKKMFAIDSSAEIGRRRRLFEQLLQQVKAIGATPIFSELPDGVCPYGFAFRFRQELHEKLRIIARRHHVTLTTWPDLPEDVAQNAPEHYKNVWVFNFR